MSNNIKKRRAKQKAFRVKAYAEYATPMFMYKDHNVPFAHRFCRKSPKDMRKNIGGMISKWKNKYYNTQGLARKVQQYLVKGPERERLRGVVEHEIFGQFGMEGF